MVPPSILGSFVTYNSLVLYFEANDLPVGKPVPQNLVGEVIEFSKYLALLHSCTQNIT